MFLINNIHYLINCIQMKAPFITLYYFFIYNSYLFYRYNIDYKINTPHFGREMVLQRESRS